MATLSELVRAQLEQDPWWQALQRQKGGPAGGLPVDPAAGGVTASAFGPPTQNEVPFFRTDKDLELAARLRATAGVARAGGIRGVTAGQAGIAGVREHGKANLHQLRDPATGKVINKLIAGDGTIWRRKRGGGLESLGTRF